MRVPISSEPVQSCLHDSWDWEKFTRYVPSCIEVYSLVSVVPTYHHFHMHTTALLKISNKNLNRKHLKINILVHEYWLAGKFAELRADTRVLKFSCWFFLGNKRMHSSVFSLVIVFLIARELYWQLNLYIDLSMFIALLKHFTNIIAGS